MADVPHPLYENYFEESTLYQYCSELAIIGTPAEGRTDRLIHWRVFVIFGTNSVEIDTVQILDTGDKVQIWLQENSYIISNNAKFLFKFQIPPIQIVKYRDLILQRKLHHYRYNGNGSGCLFWICRFLAEVERAGWMEPGKTDEFTASTEMWRKGEEEDKDEEEDDEDDEDGEDKEDEEKKKSWWIAEGWGYFY